MEGSMEGNPNEYDDDAFLEASLAFQNTVTSLINDLWNAGASASDITSEFNTAFENSDAEGVG